MPDLRNTPPDMENPIIIPNVSAEELKEVFSALKLKGGTVFPDGTFTIHRFLTTVHGKWGSGADGSLFVTVDSHRDDVEKALTGFLASVRGERK